MAVHSHSGEAGGHAEQRYGQGLRGWRSANRVLFAIALGPFIAAGIVVLLIDGHQLSWCAGALTGAFVGVWAVLRDSPPRYIETWRVGAEGERKTAAALRALERSGWRVLHDVKARRGNYDHLVVGRPGVFLIETKNLQGVVELRDGVPHLLRRLDPEADTRLAQIRPRALGAAAGLKEEIERRSGQRVWVQAVVVLWADFPEGLVDDGKCVFIHGSRLRAWLEQGEHRLSDGALNEVGAGLASLAASGGMSEAATAHETR